MEVKGQLVGGDSLYCVGPGTELILSGLGVSAFPNIGLQLLLSFLLYACVFSLHVFLCITYVPGAPRRPEEDIRCPGTGVKDGCEQLCGCWGSNLGPLEEKPMVLTTKPSF